ncbi:MAG: site-2 protease family protein [Pseudomonadota bacterium]
MISGETASILPPLMALGVLALFTSMVAPAVDPRRWPLAIDLSRQGLVFGALGLAVIFYFFRSDPVLAGVIVGAIMLHEYGHVLAFRLAGHPRPVFRLAPLGGVAFSDRAPRSQAENAYIALMGPGFSLALIVALLLLAWMTRETEVERAARLLVDGGRSVSEIALLAAGVVGALNFFNLLPFYPLDGGRTLKAAASAAGHSVAANAAIIMSVALALLAFFVLQSLLLLFFALIGLALAKQEEAIDRALEPMSRGTAALTTAAYLATTVAHGAAALPLAQEVVRSLQPPLAQTESPAQTER